jgi:hypothetical protein
LTSANARDPPAVWALQSRGDMQMPGPEKLLSAGLLFGLIAGCASSPERGDDGDAIACGYFVERGTYAVTNLQFIDFASSASSRI